MASNHHIKLLLAISYQLLVATIAICIDLVAIVTITIIIIYVVVVVVSYHAGADNYNCGI